VNKKEKIAFELRPLFTK